ncbi:MAG: hypothetical protein GXP01_03915 [Alphaproteobacteria bacterium]|nr:hypothetical protein [Alphaproteobacteria bacterium]
MKRLEAFTLGKKYNSPQDNEDALVVMPFAGYAVIDGVTDRNGTRYDGVLSGQFAARRIARATERFFLAQTDTKADPPLRYTTPERFIAYLTTELRRGYAENNALDAVNSDWKVRAGCTMMAAFVIGDRLEIVAVGDSGIRVNGDDVLQVLKPLDDVTSFVRQHAWEYFAKKGVSAELCGQYAADMTWSGSRHQKEGTPTAGPGVIEEISGRALLAAKAHLPNVPEGELMELIEHGIRYGQGNFQNSPDRALGYGCVDGFDVPAAHIATRSYALSDVHSIELFSDGYFKLGDTFGVRAWEQAFDEVEAEDPHKIYAYASTKGSTNVALTDDRTYLGVMLQ